MKNVNKRRVNPKDDVNEPPRKRQMVTRFNNSNTEKFTEEQLPMIYCVPFELLGLVVNQLQLKDKLNLMCSSRHLHQQVPKLIYELDLKPYSSRIISQKVITGTLQRLTALKSLVLDGCHLERHYRPFVNALVGLTDLNNLSMCGIELPHSTLSQYVVYSNNQCLVILAHLENRLYRLFKLTKLRLVYVGYLTQKILCSWSNLVNLQELDIGRNIVCEMNTTLISSLTKMTALQSLSIRDSVMPAGTGDVLMGVYGDLKTLDISGLRNRHLPTATSHPHLKELICVTEVPLWVPKEDMEQPPPLERLTASVAALRHLVDVPIPSLVYLEVVDVSHNIEANPMAIHDTFPNLRTLKLSRLGQSATSIVPYLIYCNHYLEVLENLILDIWWDFDEVGTFRVHLKELFTAFTHMSKLKSLSLRVFMDSGDQENVNRWLEWSGVISVCIDVTTLHILQTIPNCDIILVYIGGHEATGKTLVCSYKDGNWGTTRQKKLSCSETYAKFTH